MELRCLLGIHRLEPVDFKDDSFKDEKHGWVEQDYCILCNYKSTIRTYCQLRGVLKQQYQNLERGIDLQTRRLRSEQLTILLRTYTLKNLMDCMGEEILTKPSSCN